ncbi:MAG TPA: inositol monophosphatase family protein, partial [Bauldia sp.]|nr:inositol monophosphatase family protein [Bauldia sp.]
AARAAGREAVGFRYVPSLAYRLALVADGTVDVAIAKANARDWDLAAADLLVHEAGARLTDLSGRRLDYNREGAIHPALVAANPALVGAAADLVREVHGRED